MNLNILGLIVPCVLSSEESDNQGEYCLDTKTITLFAKETKDNVILHEAIHATFHRLGFKVDDQLEELLTNALENMIVENFHIKAKDESTGN
jgi:hypothetical protein